MDLNEIYKTNHGDLSSLDILLVDGADEGETLALVSMISACNENYRVHHVKSIGEARQHVQRDYVEVVIFNLSLFGIASLEALIEPAVELNKPYALIALVREGEEALGAEATGSGAETYIVREELTERELAKSIHLSLKCHHLRLRNINLVLIDKTTGFLSRRGFMMLAEQEVKVAQRYKRKMFMLFAEIDEFEKKKEHLDAAGADKILRETGNVIRHSFRGADILSSFDDGRFAGLAVGAEIDSSKTIESRLKTNLNSFNAAKVLTFELNLHVGIVALDLDASQTIEELMEEADRLLEAQKRR